MVMVITVCGKAFFFNIIEGLTILRIYELIVIGFLVLLILLLILGLGLEALNTILLGISCGTSLRILVPVGLQRKIIFLFLLILSSEMSRILRLVFFCYNDILLLLFCILLLLRGILL